MILLACNQRESSSQLALGFEHPPFEYRPETWFHFIGNNISKEGITQDLEAIKEAGLQGIHLFNKSGQAFPKVEQIEILSPEWEEMIRHAANECERLGLKFTMQNCPGWSMTGGPWVPAQEAQRELVETVYHFKGGQALSTHLEMEPKYEETDYNYQDVALLAFPSPNGDASPLLSPISTSSNNSAVPWERIINPVKRVEMVNRKLPADWKPYSEIGITPVGNERTWVRITFDEPLCLRSLIFPPIRFMLPGTEYPVIDVRIKVQAKIDGQLAEVAEIKIPDGNWNDRQLDLTLAVPEATSNEFVLSFLGDHVLNPGYIYLSSKPRLHNHEAMAARAFRRLQRSVDVEFGQESMVGLSQIVDLSGKMDQEGNLNWDMPEGEWTLVRFGHVNMRRTNKPAVPEATGWEASKLDKISIENHLRKGMIGNLMREDGPIAGGKLDGLLIDSWESFIPTWSMHSEDMFREFEARRGYPLKSFLPATMGYIVESPEVTTKFLRDLRHTMDELYVENFFSHFATVAHEMGAEVYTEGAGGEVLPIDPMRYYGVADIPMTEFWYPGPPSAQNEYAKPIFHAASAMHVYNKPKLAAEACTQIGVKWNEHPYSVKGLIDYNLTKGVNHLVFHTFTHTPQNDVYPGSSFGGNIGFPLVRQQTWWQHMSAWTDYLTRNQFMLQQGEYVADVLRYYGDHYERPPFDLDFFPKGYRFDYLNAEILHNKLRVHNGLIHVEEAGSYRVIDLGDSRELMLSTIKRLKELVIAGAVVLGDKPVDSPSLMDDDDDLKALKKISDELWGDGHSGVKAVGRGRVYWGKNIEEVLDLEGVSPDFHSPEELQINWIHRETENEDIYFISSRNKHTLRASVGFRIQDAAPEIWDAFTGKRQKALVWDRDETHTQVAITLDPKGSTIVVFPKGSKGSTCSEIQWNGQTILQAKADWTPDTSHDSLVHIEYYGEDLVASKSGTYTFHYGSGNKDIEVETEKTPITEIWDIAFDQAWDTPELTSTAQLASLTEFDDESIKYFSGTATYSSSFSFQKQPGQVSVDLGDVHNIASLWCNGKPVGTRWAPPYSFAVTEYVKDGENEIVVKVTNTWRNQLIYDQAKKAEDKRTWTTGWKGSQNEPLDMSGLVGPVFINTCITK